MSDFRKVCPQCQRTFQDEDALEILTDCPDDGSVLIFETIDPIVGTLLADRYRVEALIGRGATSTVYHATDLEARPSDGEGAVAVGTSVAAVAVKVLHPHLSGDAAVVKRLSQEAKSLRDFSHKNVVNVLSLGVTRQGQPFLVMELVEGQSLLDHLRNNGALNKYACVTIFDQILDAIGAAHTRGILHRDLKPGNIMLAATEEGGFHVKVLDFGIAKIVPLQGDTFFRLTQTGEMMGSLLYMSPEQCLEQDWDQRGDIYSLGCVFYEALTARAPLIGRTAFETMNKHLTEMPPPLSVVRPDIQFARGINYVIMKMLDKDPQARYQTAEEVRNDLRMVADGNGSQLEARAAASTKGKGFNIATLTGKDANAQAINDPNLRGELMAAKLKDYSRQRMFEVGIFLVLMVIWAVPLLFAFAFTPNALIAACLFGVLLPFLAAVSAMVVVRLPRIQTINKLKFQSIFTPWHSNSYLLPHFAETGSLLLGTESSFMSSLFGGGARKVIEPFQRVQSLPLLILGKERTGKTSLLASLAANDLDDARRAQFVLSPDGELASLVTRWIAAHPQGKAMSRRVLLIDLDQELSQVSIAEGYGYSAVQEVSERIVEAMEGSESGRGKEWLSSEQTYMLQSSIALLLAANEVLSNLPAFLTQQSKRKEVFEKLPQWQGLGKQKNPLVALRKFIEEREGEEWNELTKPILAICYRFPLEADNAALRIFWQHSSLISEVINKRRVMIVKGSSLSTCPLFFRLVFNEVLKQRRPSARLSDAESYPVVYIDDVEECGISDTFAKILGTPSETGIEFLLSTRTLSNFSDKELSTVLGEIGGLGVFAVSESDAATLMPLYQSYFNKPSGLLANIDKDLAFFDANAQSNLYDNQTKVTLPNMPQMNYLYLSKTPGSKPLRLLAPYFPEIRITEVEWSTVESMRTGWMFNL